MKIDHSRIDLPENVVEQLEFRSMSLAPVLGEIDKLDAVCARGGPMKPVAGGTYRITEPMLRAYRKAEFSNHASNLGALLADKVCGSYKVPGFVVDPVTVDEFIPEARISGVPGIERRSRSHALNLHFCGRRAATELNLPQAAFKCVAAHLGSGFSIAALSGGRIIDVNDGLLGMGPFSVERAGALPLQDVLDLVFKNKLSESELIELFSKNSGLKGYLGTADFKQIEELLVNDKHAADIYQAMIYQIVKEIGAMYAVLKGRADCLVITGGLAKSPRLISAIKDRTAFLPEVRVYPGSFELEALAAGAVRVLNKEEKVLKYA